MESFKMNNDLPKSKLGKGLLGCLGLIVLLIVIGIFAGNTDENSSSTTGTNNTSAPTQSSTTSTNDTTQDTPQGKVEVKSHQLKKGTYYDSVVGEVVNNTGKNATFVKVTATFYDKNGQVTGTDYTYAGDTADTALTPGATAPFEITVLDQDTVIDTYKLDVTWN